MHPPFSQDLRAAVLFASSTCPNCANFKPAFLAVARTHSQLATFYALDIDKDPSGETLANHYHVQGLPTVIFLSQGVAVGRLVGDAGEANFQQRLHALFGGPQ